jgi:hypothetical protein
MSRSPWSLALAVSLAVLSAVSGSAEASPLRTRLTNLDGAQVSSPEGQTFPWTFGADSGTVNVRSNFSTIAYSLMGSSTPSFFDGLNLRSTQSAEHPEPFVGIIDFTYSRPVKLGIWPTGSNTVQLENFEDSPFRIAGNGGWSGEPVTRLDVYEWLEVTSPDPMSPTDTLYHLPLKYGLLPNGVRFDPKYVPFKTEVTGAGRSVPAGIEYRFRYADFGIVHLGGYSRNYRITYFSDVQSSLGPESLSAVFGYAGRLDTVAFHPVVAGVLPVPEPTGCGIAVTLAAALVGWARSKARTVAA